MKRIFIMLLFVCIGFNLSAQTLHSLVFINKCESEDRKDDRTADYNKMQKFLTDVANRLGYTNNLRMHTCNEFTVSKALSEVNNLNVRENNVVIFYYHGHGANLTTNKYDKWPAMHLSPIEDNVDISTFLEQSKLRTELESRCRNAKLVLCIADCCNGFAFKSNAANTMETRYKDNIKKLFTGFSGQKFIMISACKAGQLGYSLSTGSVYGDYFREAIDYYSGQDNPTWESVLSRAQTKTANDNARRNHTSEPQYEIINYGSAHSGDVIWK